ncbi:MAG: glutamate-5-semialdehyde dehydrogenase [Bacteroidota bacterium]
MKDIPEIGKTTKNAAIQLSGCHTETKNKALAAIAHLLKQRAKDIFEVNQADIAESEKNNLSAPLLKRLKFDQQKLEDVIAGIHSLIKIPDPVGHTLDAKELDSGLELYKVSCPIGVIGVIFESRPDALVQISTLCLKSGNGVLLKGGSEASRTNKILSEIIEEATIQAGIPAGWIHLLESRSDVNRMLELDDYIDLIIPRGSNEFVKYIMDHSNIAVLGHADGICHVYIDNDADIQKAIDITVDSKTQYVAVCNALETLLIHENIAESILPALKKELETKNVIIKGCAETQKIIKCEKATEEDWKTEYLDYILSIKIVKDQNEAVNHINQYGSGHTDSIVTRNEEKAMGFMNLTDSGNVFWNCSTRFSDGYRYGLGAEVGISTNKIHARGPVGLEGLLIYKWKMIGHGQTVTPYASGEKSFTHLNIDKHFPESSS